MSAHRYPRPRVPRPRHAGNAVVVATLTTDTAVGLWWAALVGPAGLVGRCLVSGRTRAAALADARAVAARLVP